MMPIPAEVTRRQRLHAASRPPSSYPEWKAAATHALPVQAFVLGLYYYWFGIADRRYLFLYEHRGATPFDATTSSRYWVAGLVASACVLITYTGACWLGGQYSRIRGRAFQPPAWWRVWAIAAGPVAAGTVLIVSTAGSPALPWPLALASAATAVAGLALALMPAALAASRPRTLVWLAADGLALAPTLLLLRAIELPTSGLKVSMTLAWTVVGAGLATTGLALAALSGLRAWRRQPPSSPLATLCAGLAVAYLGMPLLHHLVFTPPDYRYISAGANFFASSAPMQLTVVASAALIAMGAAALRRRWSPPG